MQGRRDGRGRPVHWLNGRRGATPTSSLLPAQAGWGEWFGQGLAHDLLDRADLVHHLLHEVLHFSLPPLAGDLGGHVRGGWAVCKRIGMAAGGRRYAGGRIAPLDGGRLA